MRIRQLPKGYYAIQSDWKTASKDTFSFRGITYSVTEGVNLFASVHEANAHALEIPEIVLEGLSYEAFTTPVLLFSAGSHKIDELAIDHSLTFLGCGAGINPNTPGASPLKPPSLTPARSQAESILKGGFWRGYMTVDEAVAETLIFDGFTMWGARFEDRRSDGGSCYVSFRNIIQKGPCGYVLHTFAPAIPDGTLDRQIFFQNIRVADFDDYGFGGIFAQVNARKAIFEGICYDTKDQSFGFTDYSRSWSNCAVNSQVTEYLIRNSFFRNTNGFHGIAISCNDAEDRVVKMTVANSVFIDASRKDEAVLQPQLPNESSSLVVKGCVFVDTRQNRATAIRVHGPKGNVVSTDCRIEGFADIISSRIPPAEAPDSIENHMENWTTQTTDPIV